MYLLPFTFTRRVGRRRVPIIIKYCRSSQCLTFHGYIKESRVDSISGRMDQMDKGPKKDPRFHGARAERNIFYEKKKELFEFIQKSLMCGLEAI